MIVRALMKMMMTMMMIATLHLDSITLGTTKMRNLRTRRILTLQSSLYQRIPKNQLRNLTQRRMKRRENMIQSALNEAKHLMSEVLCDLIILLE